MFSFLLLLVLGLLLFAGLFLRMVGGLFFPWSRPFNRQNEEQTKQKPEGSVNIDYVPPRQEMKDSRPGNNAPESDYVDYEEVKNDSKPEN